MFTGLGGQIDQGGFVTTCMPSDLAMLKAFLHEALWADVSTEDWWDTHRPE